ASCSGTAVGTSVLSGAMVHNLIPTTTLPVASQRLRACREVMEERRDITFPVTARPVWDAGPCAFSRGGKGGTLTCAPSADAVARNGWDSPPPSQGEDRLGANPTWSDGAPTPPGKTTLE